MGPASAAVLYAVVVGWNGSPSPGVPPLRFADDDAAQYARLLRDAGARTTLLTTFDADSRALQADTPSDGPPTRAALFEALAAIDRRIAAEEAPAELIVVYTGHGDVDHGEGFVTLDGSRLTRTDLRDRVLSGRRAERLHVIVDACKSYYLVFARGGERRRHEAAFVDAQAAELLPRVGFTLSTSSDADSHEWEEVQGGVFSHEVRSALRGAADADGDGAVSYAELGAFVRTANLAIANPRYRPRFTVVPPADSRLGARTPLLGWRGASAARTVRLDSAGDSRFSVDDGVGRRLLDANLAVATAVHLPRAALYVWSRPGDHEYALAAADADVALSQLSARPRRVAARGALQDAFAQLFARPFGEAAVGDWLAHPAADVDDEPAPDRRRTATLALAGVAATVGAAGIACTVAAAILRGAVGPSQAEHVAANDRIDALNGAAIGLYSGAVAAGAVSAILGLWPRSKDSKVDVRPAPGPGGLGLSLVGAFP
jgi:hypothetical protein